MPVRTPNASTQAAPLSRVLDADTIGALVGAFERLFAKSSVPCNARLLAASTSFDQAVRAWQGADPSNGAAYDAAGDAVYDAAAAAWATFSDVMAPADASVHQAAFELTWMLADYIRLPEFDDPLSAPPSKLRQLSTPVKGGFSPGG